MPLSILLSNLFEIDELHLLVRPKDVKNTLKLNNDLIAVAYSNILLDKEL